MIEHPDLVRAGHRDEQQRAVDRQVPRRVERDSASRAPPSSRHMHCSPVPATVVTTLRVEVDGADQVVARCRPPTACRRRAPGPAACGTPASPKSPSRVRPCRRRCDRARAPSRLAHDDLVVVRVADEQPIGGRQHLAGKQQRRSRRRLRVPASAPGGVRSISPRSSNTRDHGGDRLLEALVVALARRRADDVAGRIDDARRRPRPHGVGAPDAELGVVGDRVLDLVAAEDLPDVLGGLLVGELAAWTPITTSSSGNRSSSFFRSGRMCMQLMQP